jgi:hypothetical protein
MLKGTMLGRVRNQLIGGQMEQTPHRWLLS